MSLVEGIRANVVDSMWLCDEELNKGIDINVGVGSITNEVLIKYLAVSWKTVSCTEVFDTKWPTVVLASWELGSCVNIVILLSELDTSLREDVELYLFQLIFAVRNTGGWPLPFWGS